MNRSFLAGFVLFFVQIMCVTHAGAQDFRPVSVSGFNEDVVAEGGASGSLISTSREMDAVFPSNNVLCTRDFASQFDFQPPDVYGLPEAGLLEAPGRRYRFAPWEENNSLYLFPGDSGVLALDTPARFSDISLLMLATEGSSDVRLTFRFSDGSVQVVNQSIPDWFSAVPATPFQGFGRVKRKDPPFLAGEYEAAPGGNPKMFPFDFTLPCTRTLTAIGIRNLSAPGGSFRSFVFAVSGKEQKARPAISIQASTTTLCAGDTVRFSTLFSQGGTAPEINWFLNGNPVSQQTAWFSTDIRNGDSVRCRLTSNAVCAFPASVFSNTLRFQVLPRVNPGLTLDVTDSVICRGKRVVFDAIPDEPGPFTYAWYRNGIQQPAAGLTFFSSQLEDGDRIWAIIRTAAPCATRTEASTDTVRMKVFPVVTLQFSLPDTLETDSAPVSLTGNAAGGIFSGPGVTGSSFDPAAAGTGTHMLQYWLSGNPCTDTVARKVVVRDRPLPCATEPMTMFTPNQDLKNETWWIGDFHSRCLQTARVRVYNRWGLLVYRNDDYRNNWAGEMEEPNMLSLPAIPDGPYFFYVEALRFDGLVIRRTGVLTRMTTR